MENGGVELIGLMQLDDRCFKERLVGAIFGPSIMPFVDIGKYLSIIILMHSGTHSAPMLVFPHEEYKFIFA